MIMLKQLEEKAGPALKWAGQCHGIAMIAAEMIEGAVALYGHYLGQVDEKSMFHVKLLIQHGCVLLPDGRILDPTRWEFEGKKPYLFVTDDGEDYDEGGNKFRTANRSPPPAFDSADKFVTLNERILSGPARAFAERTLCCDHAYGECELGVVTIPQLFWLANMDPRAMEGHAKDIYKMFKKLDLIGFVPIDNQNMVKQGRDKS